MSGDASLSQGLGYPLGIQAAVVGAPCQIESLPKSFLNVLIPDNEQYPVHPRITAVHQPVLQGRFTGSQCSCLFGKITILNTSHGL